MQFSSTSRDGIVNALLVVLDRLEDDGAAAMLHQMRRGGRGLEHRAVGRKIAAQHGHAAVLHQRLVKGTNDFLVPIGRIFAVFPNGFSIYGESILVDHAMLSQRADHRGHAAGIIEIFHQKAA